MSYSLPVVLSCLASNNAWRRQATHLREHATLAHLTDKQRDLLLREAAAAERQADMWLQGAIEAHPIGRSEAASHRLPSDNTVNSCKTASER